MTYQLPEKEYNEEKYSQYLIELGFRKLTQQDADRLQGDYSGYEWYIYDGDLELDELLIGTLSLVITGDLILHQPFVDIDETCGCLIVHGQTKVNYMEMGQSCSFYGGIEFEILHPTGSGQGDIYNPQGRLFYSDSDGMSVDKVNPKKVEVYYDKELGKHFGDIAQLLPKKYLCYDEEVLTYEAFLAENDKADWAYYIFEMGLYIDDIRKIWQDVMDGKQVFLD